MSFSILHRKTSNTKTKPSKNIKCVKQNIAKKDNNVHSKNKKTFSQQKHNRDIILCDTSDPLNPYRPGANIYDDYYIYGPNNINLITQHNGHLGGYVEAPITTVVCPMNIITRYRNPILMQTEIDCAKSCWPGITSCATISNACNTIIQSEFNCARPCFPFAVPNFCNQPRSPVWCNSCNFVQYV